MDSKRQWVVTFLGFIAVAMMTIFSFSIGLIGDSEFNKEHQSYGVYYLVSNAIIVFGIYISIKYAEDEHVDFIASKIMAPTIVGTITGTVGYFVSGEFGTGGIVSGIFFIITLLFGNNIYNSD